MLVAISGGADSLALLHALASRREELGVEVLAVHVHHEMRGSEAEDDARFLEATCQTLELTLRVVRRDVPGMAADLGMGLEEAGRVARYEALRQVAEELGCDRIATAHHADDHAETILMNLMRGCGLSGLGGIPESRPLHAGRGAPLLVRPLLQTRRAELEAYCHEQGLAPRHDRTNDDLAYRRNRIRQRVMPMLLAEEPMLVEKLVRTARQADEAVELLERLAGDLRNACHVQASSDHVELNVGPLRAAPPPVARQLLRETALQLGCDANDLDSATVERLYRLAEADHGAPVTLPGGVHRMRVDGQDLVFECARPAVPQVPSPVVLQVPPAAHDFAAPSFGLMLEVATGCAPTDLRLRPDRAILPVRSIREPLVVRAPVKGDRLQPLGAPGSRLLSDLFIDRKVPRAHRATWPLVADQEGILWVMGLAVSERCRVLSSEDNCLILTRHPFQQESSL